MAEAVYIVNSKTLTRNSEDDQPLTPNHLLHLRLSSGLSPGIFSKDDLLCTRAWRQGQYLADIPVFWRRWTKVPPYVNRAEKVECEEKKSSSERCDPDSG